MNETPSSPPLTTRRGFVFGAGFGVLALYGVWAANGAAPLNPFGGAAERPAGGAAHSGHGGGTSMSTAEFRQLTEAFIAANLLPDGSVQPDHPAHPTHAAHEPEPELANAHGAHDAHGASAAAPDHSGHNMSNAAPTEVTAHQALPAQEHGAAPVDVYLLAHQWGYLPAVLRLQTGVRYRFRMMAEDVAHGASLQLGPASHIVRLRARTLVEQEVQFTSAGEHLLYCTVYCGVGHDRMQGRIIVSSATHGATP